MTTQRSEFAQYCCELLSAVGVCVVKRMFGGYGISTDGMSIAIVANLGDGEKLWLKANAETAKLFEKAGCERFTYTAKGKLKSMAYYSAPNEAMESANEMAYWARLALDAALLARNKKVKL